jgi:hypothetical protein
MKVIIRRICNEQSGISARPLLITRYWDGKYWTTDESKAKVYRSFVNATTVKNAIIGRNGNPEEYDLKEL